MRIAKAGWPFILGCFAAGILLWILGGMLPGSAPDAIRMLAGVAILGGIFCAYFFRDPARLIPQGDHLILSPADGKVMEIVEGQDPLYNEPAWVIKIFLSVFDPHIQRSPVAGAIRRIAYKRGCFLDARDPKACIENEQNRLEIVPAARPTMPIAVTQIAGLIARRIVCWSKEGQHLAAGEQFGLIRFGSQVDVVLPKNVQLKIKAGDRLEAGASILAEVR